MTLEKTELKKQVLKELGQRFAETERQTEQDYYRVDGALRLLRDVLIPKAIPSINEFWTNERKQKKIRKADLATAKKVLAQFEGSFKNLIQQHEQLLPQIKGSQSGVMNCMTVLENEFKAEEEKAEKVVGLAIEGEPKEEPRESGEHPGASLPDKRRAAELHEEKDDEEEDEDLEEDEDEDEDLEDDEDVEDAAPEPTARHQPAPVPEKPMEAPIPLRKSKKNKRR